MNVGDTDVSDVLFVSEFHRSIT